MKDMVFSSSLQQKTTRKNKEELTLIGGNHSNEKTGKAFDFAKWFNGQGSTRGSSKSTDKVARTNCGFLLPNMSCNGDSALGTIDHDVTMSLSSSFSSDDGGWDESPILNDFSTAEFDEHSRKEDDGFGPWEVPSNQSRHDDDNLLQAPSGSGTISCGRVSRACTRNSNRGDEHVRCSYDVSVDTTSKPYNSMHQTNRLGRPKPEQLHQSKFQFQHQRRCSNPRASATTNNNSRAGISSHSRSRRPRPHSDPHPSVFDFRLPVSATETSSFETAALFVQSPSSSLASSVRQNEYLKEAGHLNPRRYSGTSSRPTNSSQENYPPVQRYKYPLPSQKASNSATSSFDLKSPTPTKNNMGKLFKKKREKNTSSSSKKKQLVQRKASAQQPAKREWKSAVDPASGRTYYYDTKTRETQWHKPIELASDHEKRAIAEKEQKQKDFFQSMEANILKCMQNGVIPGTSKEEDQVHPLSSSAKANPIEKPKRASETTSKKSTKILPKPQLFRTISSMDTELLTELTSKQTSPVPSPDSVVTNLHPCIQPLAPNAKTREEEEKEEAMTKIRYTTEEMIQLSMQPSSSTNNSPSSSSSSPLSASLPVSSSSSLEKPTLRKRNTCGTAYVKNTMTDPDKDATIKCVCGIYRAHLLQSAREEALQQTPKTTFEEYEIFNDDYNQTSTEQENLNPISAASSVSLASSKSSSSSKLKWFSSRNGKNSSTAKNQSKPKIVETNNSIEMSFSSSESDSEETQQQMVDYTDLVPSLEEITSFYRFVFHKAQMESDCIIMSIIYVERLLRETNGGVRPCHSNWRSVLFSCMVMSSKVWDDLSMWNKDFSKLFPSGVKFTLQRINELELALLHCFKFNVKVKASEYAKYYFLMRSMLIRSGLAGEELKNTTSPLDVEGAKKLEFLSASYNSRAVLPSPSKPNKLSHRSKSVGDADGRIALKDGVANISPVDSNQVKLGQIVQM